MSFKIKTMNKISAEGLSIFKDRYTIGDQVDQPDAILVRSAQVNTPDFPSILAVGRAGAGVNNISIPAATEQGVCVFNTPGANANAVAELVFIMLGYAARNVGQSIHFTKNLSSAKDDKEISELVENNKSKYKGFELAGKTLAVVGLGKIGVLVANYGIHHHMNVVAFDPFPTISNIHQLDSKVNIVGSMSAVVAGADVVTVHVPLTEKTKGIVSKEEILSMNDGGIVCNYARKGIVDDQAVVEYLKQGKLLSYLSDFPTKALLEVDRVICTPHLGASTAESEENCSIMISKQIKEYLEFGTVTNSVNFPIIEMPVQKATKSRIIVINRDVPNMIGYITSCIGQMGINIQSFSNESNGKIGYNIIDFDDRVPASLVGEIRKIENVIRVREISFY